MMCNKDCSLPVHICMLLKLFEPKKRWRIKQGSPKTYLGNHLGMNLGLISGQHSDWCIYNQKACTMTLTWVSSITFFIPFQTRSVCSFSVVNWYQKQLKVVHYYENGTYMHTYVYSSRTSVPVAQQYFKHEDTAFWNIHTYIHTWTIVQYTHIADVMFL